MKYKRCGECKNFTAHFMTTVCCDCEFMSNFEQKPPMTNGDRIRAMSDEELAEFLNRVKQPCDNCQLAVVEGACTETLCDDAMEKWLKQPIGEQT